MSLVSKKASPSKPKQDQLGLTCQGFLLVPNSKTPPLVKSKIAEGKGMADKAEAKGGKEPVKCYESLPTFLIMPPPAMSPTSASSFEEPKPKSVSPRLKKFLSRFSSKMKKKNHQVEEEQSVPYSRYVMGSSQVVLRQAASLRVDHPEPDTKKEQMRRKI